MDGIKEILNKYTEIKRIGKHGKFVILNTNIATLEKELKERSEQLPSKDEMEIKLDYLIANKQESFKTKYDKLTFKFGFRTCFYWLNKKLNK